MQHFTRHFFEKTRLFCHSNRQIGRVFLLILIVWLPIFSVAQSTKSLEEKRKKLLSDIKTTSKLLEKTTEKREATLDRFVVLQKQIGRREELISTLETTVLTADSSILRNEQVISSLSSDVERMKSDYGRQVRTAFRRKKTLNPLFFLFSAATFNQAFRRLLFLRKYDAGRRLQASAIRFTQAMLVKKIASLEVIRIEKSDLLFQATGQKVTLHSELSSKESMLKNLENDQDRLQKELLEKERKRLQLDQAIEKIIQEQVARRAAEMRRTADLAAEKARKSAESVSKKEQKAEKPKTNIGSKTEKSAEKPRISAPIESAEEDLSTLDFRKLQGRLPWPVESGFISKNYGKQPHPTLKNIQITNNGIDIRTENNVEVRCVAEGVVVGVQSVPGHDNLVIVRHGNFYTVYSNISEVFITSGQTISAKQAIGRVRFNEQTETSEVHFEIWQGKERLNPTGWVRK